MRRLLLATTLLAVAATAFRVGNDHATRVFNQNGDILIWVSIAFVGAAIGVLFRRVFAAALIAVLVAGVASLFR